MKQLRFGTRLLSKIKENIQVYLHLLKFYEIINTFGINRALHGPLIFCNGFGPWEIFNQGVVLSLHAGTVCRTCTPHNILYSE